MMTMMKVENVVIQGVDNFDLIAVVADYNTDNVVMCLLLQMEAVGEKIEEKGEEGEE